MSDRASIVSEVSKDKYGHSFRFSLIKTTQRFKISSRSKNCNSFGEIDKLIEKVKKQLSNFNHLEKSWNKYDEKSKDASAACKCFEETMMASCGVEQVDSFPETSKPYYFGRSTEIFEDMKKKLEQVMKELKDADNLRQNYFAYKRLYEKSNDQKKANAKRYVDESYADLSQRIGRFQQQIPKQISDNEARIYDYMVRYYQRKRESLTTVVESTKDVLNQLKQMRDSNPVLKLSEPTVTTSGLNPIGSHVSSQHNDNANSNLSTILPSATFTPNSESNKNSNEPPHTIFGSIGSDSKNDTDLTMKPKPFEVVATYAYKSEEDDELEFVAGDEITVQEWPCPEDEEPGWLYGKHAKTGKEGLFPFNHVKII